MQSESLSADRTQVGETSRMGSCILVVDDLPSNVALVASLLKPHGHQVLRASDGNEALRVIDQHQPDLVLMDVLMPGLNGFDVCRLVKENPATRLIPIVLITALSDAKNRIEGIHAGADDFLSKPFNVHELTARVESLLRFKHYTDELDSAEQMILSLALTIEARDSYTEGHCQRLADYATALGVSLGLSRLELNALHRGGFLHDIGKVGVPDSILLKPGSLTREEFEQIKLHTTIGDRLLTGLRSLRHTRPIVRHHHERLDGTGYPDGLTGDEIPLLAQIMGVVDVFDALTTERPYKPALSAGEAYLALEKDVHRGWRSQSLVEEFIALHRSGRIAELVAEALAGLRPAYGKDRSVLLVDSAPPRVRGVLTSEEGE